MYSHGAVYVFIGLGYMLALPVFAHFFVPVYHSMKLTTAYEVNTDLQSLNAPYIHVTTTNIDLHPLRIYPSYCPHTPLTPLIFTPHTVHIHLLHPSCLPPILFIHHFSGCIYNYLQYILILSLTLYKS